MKATVNEEILRLIKKSDAVIIGSSVATMKAMMAGIDILEALEAGNNVLIASGCAPLSVDDVLAKMEEIRYGQAG